MNKTDLEQLNAQINQCIEKDNEKIDLLSSLKESSELLQADSLFKHEQTIPFPESILERIEEPDCPCKMSFLPLLKRTWLSAGKTLFIWGKADDVFIYESQEMIENAFVVDIDQNESNQFGLIVSTANRLFLHEITLADNHKITIHSNANMCTYNVSMVDVVKGVNHRYFMTGNDGHLYELEVKTWEKDRIQSSLAYQCRTERPLMRYLPTFLKSEPEARVKSVAVDISKGILYLLLADSTIQVNSIAGKTYITNSKYKSSTPLESLFVIPQDESDTICLMAVTNTAERLYFKMSNDDHSLEVVHTEKAPSVHGALLFNHQTNEKVDLAYYNQGVFAAILSKSEKTILVFTASEFTHDKKALPCYYQENTSKKIWSIMEDNNSASSKEEQRKKKRHYLKSTLERPNHPTRRFLTLSAAGISCYSKQKPVDMLSQILSIQSVKGVERFLSIYGSEETAAMCLALTKNPSDCNAAIDQFSKSLDKSSGLVLYFSRLVSSLWDSTLDQLKVKEITETENDVSHLLETLEKFDVSLEDNLKTLMLYTIQGIELIRFIHQRGWDSIVLDQDAKSVTFEQFISTDKGAQLVKKFILSAINVLKRGDDNKKCDISNFLKYECETLAGDVQLLFYQGMEHLQNAKNGDTQELQKSLDYFTLSKDIMLLNELKEIISDYCSFDFHLGAIQLINEKSKVTTQRQQQQQLDDLLYHVFQHGFDNADGQELLQKALSSNVDQTYHYKVYDWLIKTNKLAEFIQLDTDHIVTYLESSLPENEGLDFLYQHYEHKKEFGLAKTCLERLATQVDNIQLSHRVEYMDYAIDFATQQDDHDTEEIERLKKIRDIVQIQSNLHKSLIENPNVSAKSAAASLALQMKPMDVLLKDFAMKYNVYSEALCLIHLQKEYNFDYVEDAWKNTVQQINNSDLLKSKIVQIGQRIYPSVYAFPVCVLVELLDEFASKHELKNEDLALNILGEIGVPEQVVADARKLSTL